MTRTATGPSIGTMLATELRMFMRDRRTIFVSLVLPAVMLPLMLVMSRKVGELRESQLSGVSPVVALTYDAPDSVVRELRSALAELRPDEGGVTLLEQAGLDYASMLDSGTVQAVVDISMPGPAGRRTPPVVTITYRENIEASSEAADRLAAALQRLVRERRATILSDAGGTWTPDSAALLPHDTASPSGAMGAEVGRFAMLFVMLMLLSGVSVAALDSIAGERERGTLETLLASGADRGEIALAKLSAAAVVGVVILTVQTLDFLLLVRLGLFGAGWPGGVSLSAGQLISLLATFLPVSLAAASAVLYVSSVSSTFREAQMRMLPVFLLGVLPALVTLFPGIGNTVLLASLPVAGPALTARDIMAGRPEMAHIAASFLSSLGLTLLLARMVSGRLSGEDVLDQSREGPPAPATLSRKLFSFVGTMWAVNVIMSLQLERVLDTRAVVLVTQLGVILGMSLFAARKYRLSPRTDLRLVRPRAADALLAVPCAVSAVLAAAGLFSLASRVLPVDPGAVEGFGEAILPGGAGTVETLLLLCLLPAVCEEAAFRGVIMSALERRNGRAGTILLSALAFGLFHFLYFRIVPTAFLGVVLALAVLRSGSIFTGMLIHASGNAFAIFLSDRLPFLDGTRPLVWLASVAVLAGGLLLMRPVTPGRECPS